MGGGLAMRSFSRDRSVVHEKLASGTLRRIFHFARPYRSLFALLLTLLAVDAALGAAIPLLYREIINDGILGGSIPLIVWLAVATAGIAIIQSALSLVQRYASARIGEGVIYDLRTRIFGHIGRMPLAFFTRTQTGALISRLNNDVMGAQRVFTTTLTSLFGSAMTLAFTLGVMFSLSWQITLVSVALLPLFLLPARWIGRKLQTITRESYDLSAEMNSMMTERFNVAGALLVKIFGRREEEDAQFAEQAASVRDIGVRSAMYGRVFFAAMMLVAALATSLVYGWGGVMAVRGVLDVGTVVALTAYLSRLYGPLTSLSNVNVEVMTALVSFDRVFEVLDLEPLIAEAPDARPLPDAGASIEFDDVVFAYPAASDISLASLESVATLTDSPRTPVLHGVSFTAEPGQLVALVGSSGAGKTTISQLVSRLYDVDSGVVRIAGMDVREATFASLGDRVGYVTQDAHMFHDTVRANLAYARPGASDAQLWAALKDAHIDELVRTLPDGLNTVVGERGYRFSGGEKQRLAIARLLLKAPDIVVLDEATAHLDSESEAAVQAALATALAGRTSLVIAHRLSTIREADQILVLDAGRIVERGTHVELLATGGMYAELYRTQFADAGDKTS